LNPNIFCIFWLIFCNLTRVRESKYIFFFLVDPSIFCGSGKIHIYLAGLPVLLPWLDPSLALNTQLEDYLSDLVN